MGTPRRKSGVLAGEVEPYRAWLLAQGYTAGSVRALVRNVSQLGVWLGARGKPGTGIDAADVREVFAERRRQGRHGVPADAGTDRFLTYLAGRGLLVLAAPFEPSPLDSLMASFSDWMVRERGLAAGTVLRYERTARRFLTEQGLRGKVLAVAELTGADINAFLLRECARVSAGSVKGRVAELRALFRFLYVEGLIPLQLGGAVPPVGGWRLATIPPLVSADDVQRVIDSCVVGTLAGTRDRAIMLLVARLGLRSVEVARLELDDVDWRHGELTVRGKGRREDRLPLPTDVGEAVSDYLAGRGRVEESRRVFLTCRAPQSSIRPDLVNDVIERGCTRAGLTPFGPHRMRHALAAELLRQGVGLAAISQVLRHQDLATTAAYAKVDLLSLRGVAQPWPVVP